MSRSKPTKAEQAEQETARARLRELLPPGSTVYTIVTHVARSGMSRNIKVYAHSPEGPIWISGYVATLLGMPIDHREGSVKVGGCGMDMGFHITMNLSYTLHGMENVGKDAIKAGEKGAPFTPTEKNYRAGYSLIHKWL